MAIKKATGRPREKRGEKNPYFQPKGDRYGPRVKMGVPGSRHSKTRTSGSPQQFKKKIHQKRASQNDIGETKRIDRRGTNHPEKLGFQNKIGAIREKRLPPIGKHPSNGTNRKRRGRTELYCVGKEVAGRKKGCSRVPGARPKKKKIGLEELPIVMVLLKKTRGKKAENRKLKKHFEKVEGVERQTKPFGKK